MKIVVAFVFGVMACLAGCATAPIAATDAEPVALTTTDTNLATPAADKVSVTFVYGGGFLAGCPGAHVFLTLNQEGFAALLHDQRATIYIKPGQYIVSAEIGRGSVCMDSNTAIPITVNAGQPQVWNVLMGHGGVSLTPQIRGSSN